MDTSRLHSVLRGYYVRLNMLSHDSNLNFGFASQFFLDQYFRSLEPASAGASVPAASGGKSPDVNTRRLLCVLSVP